MIYIDLIIGFLKVGLFSFGGAYGAIPLIRDVVNVYGWMDEESLLDMIAISESTPGPIMVNLATYIGSTKAGLIGGILATSAVVLPAFLIIILLMIFMKRVSGNKYIKAVLWGVSPCIVGIIMATGAHMIVKNCVYPIPLAMTIILALLYFGSRKVIKKKMSPIVLIIISAVLGIAIYGA